MAIYYPIPQPTQASQRIVQEGVAPSADNPPFGLPNPIWQILYAWQPKPPMPQRLTPRITIEGATGATAGLMTLSLTGSGT